MFCQTIVRSINNSVCKCKFPCVRQGNLCIPGAAMDCIWQQQKRLFLLQNSVERPSKVC
nr:MAG TPA: hypothetical protein [Bacteriophage sp.]